MKQEDLTKELKKFCDKHKVMALMGVTQTGIIQFNRGRLSVIHLLDFVKTLELKLEQHRHQEAKGFNLFEKKGEEADTNYIS